MHTPQTASLGVLRFQKVKRIWIDKTYADLVDKPGVLTEVETCRDRQNRVCTFRRFAVIWVDYH